MYDHGHFKMCLIGMKIKRNCYIRPNLTCELHEIAQ